MYYVFSLWFRANVSRWITNWRCNTINWNIPRIIYSITKWRNWNALRNGLFPTSWLLFPSCIRSYGNVYCIWSCGRKNEVITIFYICSHFDWIYIPNSRLLELGWWFLKRYGIFWLRWLRYCTFMWCSCSFRCCKYIRPKKR